jgi:hypothetical protein
VTGIEIVTGIETVTGIEIVIETVTGIEIVIEIVNLGTRHAKGSRSSHHNPRRRFRLSRQMLRVSTIRNRWTPTRRW